MAFIRYAILVYPELSRVIRAAQYIPLATRSVLIKQCQSQSNFDDSSQAPLAVLLRNLPNFTIPVEGNYRWKVIEPLHFFNDFELSLQDRILAPILIDIIRGAPAPMHDIRSFVDKGWKTEIDLSQVHSFPDIDFTPMFYPYARPIHPDLPYNPISAFKIRRTFERLRDYYRHETRWLYPRSTHKNMSRSTRREYEKHFGVLLEEDGPIFGQDDWQRIYHETGIQLGGVVEMRQRWPTSAPKPRTYFAMGGITYSKSRFLQDFFTRLTNAFPSTNHITRLKPHLLQVPIGRSGYFLVYDLSSFTSNMKQQRSFCSALADFFRGVEVIIVDEKFGPLKTDLGVLLEEYNEHCVNNPHLSYERSPDHLGWNSIEDVEHFNASMLGIFGNLMCCTVAHFLCVACNHDIPEETDETAGDDGLSHEDQLIKVTLRRSIEFVGEYAIDKVYRSTDEGAVCLKRPIFQVGRSLELGDAIIPPCLATCLTYLLQKEVDPRYTTFGLEEMDEAERVSVVGKDLMRFLNQCHMLSDPGEIDRVCQVYQGWSRLVSEITGKNFRHFGLRSMQRYIWPCDPATYPFYQFANPFAIYTSMYTSSFEYFVRDFRELDVDSLRTAGDSVEANSDPRLQLLEKLGYLTKSEVRAHYFGPEAVTVSLRTFSRSYLPPKVYLYDVIRDIPDEFLF